jgi:DNA-binding transcriptional regulator LsrR (DeoR family)
VASRSSRRLGQDDIELATRVAWLYYESSLTQVEIAARLGLPQTRVQRLIARAVQDGIVRISISGALASCVGLEQQIANEFTLDFCRVVPAPPDGKALFSSLGRAGADYLTDAFERGCHSIVGVGHGRSIAASIEHLAPGSYPDLTVVSALGDVPRRVGANPFDVIHALADKTGAAAYLPPVPFYANSITDREMLFRQRGVVEAFRLAAQASLFIVGIGEVKPTAFLGMSGMVLPEEFATARRDGAVAELLGCFFDEAGQRVETELHDRVIALDPEVMRGREVLAIAGGRDKVAAIHAVLNAGLATALITDEDTAARLVRLKATRTPKVMTAL